MADLTHKAAADPYQMIYHSDGDVTYWDIHRQQWQRQRAANIVDKILATFSDDERRRVAAHSSEIVTGGRCCGDCNSMIVIHNRLQLFAMVTNNDNGPARADVTGTAVRQSCNNTLRAHNEDEATDADPS